MAQWYKVTLYLTHKGAGSDLTKTGYMLAENALKVLDRYKVMPGVKKDLTASHKLPDILLLSDEELKNLETMAKEQNMNLELAKDNFLICEDGLIKLLVS